MAKKLQRSTGPATTKPKTVAPENPIIPPHSGKPRVKVETAPKPEPPPAQS